MAGIIRLFFAILVNKYRGLNYQDFGLYSSIISPLKVTRKCLRIGRNVSVGNGARLEGVFSYETENFEPKILIKDRVVIQQNIHLTCASLIIIEEDVAIGANVTITDIHHGYEEIDVPIEKQRIKVNPVRIKSGSKIYNNVVILPGVTIGRNVTIGANSVVTKSIPDYSVAVGSPARIVKYYNKQTEKWEKKVY